MVCTCGLGDGYKCEDHDFSEAASAPELNGIVRRALLQTFNENHRKRTGRDAPEGWLNNSMKYIERDNLWRRVLEIIGDA